MPLANRSRAARRLFLTVSGAPGSGAAAKKAGVFRVRQSDRRNSALPRL